MSETAQKLEKILKKRKSTTVDVLGLHWENGVPPGLDIDPDLRLTIPLQIKLRSHPQGSYGLECATEYYPDKENRRPDILSEGFLPWYPHKKESKWEGQDFIFEKPIAIRGESAHPSAVEANLNVLGHEVMHAHQLQFHNLRTLLFPYELPDNSVSSDMDGMGIEMESTFALEETAEQTKQRHKKIKAENISLVKDPSKAEYYYFMETERQARLHQILAEGAKKWERMPLTAIELKAAVAKLLGGADLLNAKERRIAAKFPSDHVKKNAAAANAIRDLREECVAKLTRPQKVKFFNDVLPYSYGWLLDLYGDRQGSQRMDYLDVRPRRSVAMAHQILSERYHPDVVPIWDDEKWQKKLPRAEAKSLERLLALSLVNCNERVFTMVLGEIDRRPEEKLTTQQMDYLCGAAISHHGGAEVARPGDSAALEKMIELLRERGAMAYLLPTPAAHVPFSSPRLPESLTEVQSAPFPASRLPALSPEAEKDPLLPGRN